MKKLIEQLKSDAEQAAREYPGVDVIRRINSAASKLKDRIDVNSEPPRRKPERSNDGVEKKQQNEVDRPQGKGQ